VIAQFMQDLDMVRVLIMLVALIISLTVHEAAHALFAKLGGDPTAYLGGQVTLNPLPHMRREPFGMVVLPVLSILLSGATMCFGYAHAPVDPVWAYRNPRKAALMSAAGPLANVLLAAIAFTVLYAIGRPDIGADSLEAVRRIAAWFLLLNVLLALFNFIPMPPLDGAGIVSGLVPASRRLYDSLARIPSMSLIVIVLLFYVFPDLFWPVWRTINNLLPYRAQLW